MSFFACVCCNIFFWMEERTQDPLPYARHLDGVSTRPIVRKRAGAGVFVCPTPKKIPAPTKSGAAKG